LVARNAEKRELCQRKARENRWHMPKAQGGQVESWSRGQSFPRNADRLELGRSREHVLQQKKTEL